MEQQSVFCEVKFVFLLKETFGEPDVTAVSALTKRILCFNKKLYLYL